MTSFADLAKKKKNNNNFCLPFVYYGDTTNHAVCCKKVGNYFSK